MPSNALELIAAAVEDKRPLRLANKLLCDTVDAKVRRARARTFSASFQTIARAPWNLRALNLTATDADDSGLALLALGDWKDLEELTVCLAPDQAVTQQQVRDTLTGWPKLHTLDLSCASIIRKELLAAIADAAPCLTHLAINDVSTPRRGCPVRPWPWPWP